MGRPLGSKNKTPAELKLEGRIKVAEADLKTLKAKKQLLQDQRREGAIKAKSK